MSGKISQDQTVAFKSTLFIPGIDMSLAAGQRNIKIQAGSIASLATTPQQFGAVGDGVTDCTAAFNAALAAIAAQGGNGKLYIPAGHYKITGPLSYASGYLHVQGDGPGTELDYGSTTADMMTFSGTDITLSDFRVLTPYNTSIGGSLFNFLSASNVRLSRISTNGGFEVVQFLGSPAKPSYRTSIIDCSFVNVVSNAVFYDPYFGGGAMISDTDMLGVPTNAGIGIIIEAGDTFAFSNVNVQCFKYGILVASQTGGISYAANLFASNVLCDGAGAAVESNLSDGWNFNGSAAGTYVSRIHLSSCWAGSMGGHGFNVNNATDVTLTNCIAIANQGHGFLLNAPSSNITLDGCTAAGNSANNPNDNDGIHVGGIVTDFIVTGCRSRPGNYANTQRYGMAVEPLASNRYIISNNDFNGNMTGALGDSGTGASKFVSQNLT